MFRWSLAWLLHKVFYNSIKETFARYDSLASWKLFYRVDILNVFPQANVDRVHMHQWCSFSPFMAFDKELERTFLCWCNWNSPSWHRKDVRDEDTSACICACHCQNAQWWYGSKGQHKQAIRPKLWHPTRVKNWTVLNFKLYLYYVSVFNSISSIDITLEIFIEKVTFYTSV
jgi:hypothetical protein